MNTSAYEAGHHGFAATYRPGTDQREQKDIEQGNRRQCDGRVQCFLEEIHALRGQSRLPLLSRLGSRIVRRVVLIANAGQGARSVDLRRTARHARPHVCGVYNRANR